MPEQACGVSRRSCIIAVGLLGVLMALVVATSARMYAPNLLFISGGLPQVERIEHAKSVSHQQRSELCQSLVLPHRDNPYIKECLERRPPPLVINSFCLGARCEATLRLQNVSSTKRRRIGIVVVDKRIDHRAHKMWELYAQVHGYTYIKRAPALTGREKVDPGDDPNMDPDRATTRTILQLLADPSYHYLDFFIYTELDQWLVRPLVRLEPIFEDSGLTRGGKAMAVFGEYPCDNIRDGGHFNMGNFLFRRGADLEKIFLAWNASRAYTRPRGSHRLSPRQGAFSVDVYQRFSAKIAAFPSGCPLGTPFGEMVGHMTSGVLQFLYEPGKARALLPMLIDCVHRRLQEGGDRPCAVYPPWVDAPCVRCPKTLHVKPVTVHYDTCCGNGDSALAEEALEDFLRRAGPSIMDNRLGMLCPTVETCRNLRSHPLECQTIQCVFERARAPVKKARSYVEQELGTACTNLVLPYSETVDIKECRERRSGPLVINNNCLWTTCDSKLRLSRFNDGSSGQRRNVGIVTVDDRRDHAAHEMWKLYAQAHSYTYIPLKHRLVGREVVVPADDRDALLDFTRTWAMLDMLADPAYRHLDLFMYTDLDHWLVRPLARLEVVFENSGLLGGDKAMAVFGEYPCDNIRDGGHFNMGHFLYRRGADLEKIFLAWNASRAFPRPSGSHYSLSRPVAFSVDVFPKFHAEIATLPGGCPLGTPFGEVVGHITGGALQALYDPGKAIPLLPMLINCARQRLQEGGDRPCAIYPPWVDAPCARCSKTLRVTMANAKELTVYYDTCCGDTDSALPQEALEKYLRSTGLGAKELHLGMLCPSFDSCQDLNRHPLKCQTLGCAY